MFAVYAMQRDLCSKRSKVPYVFFLVAYVQSAERFHMFFFFTTLRKNRRDLYHHPLHKSQPSIVARHMRRAFYHDTTKFSNYNRQSSINRLQNTIHRRVDVFFNNVNHSVLTLFTAGSSKSNCLIVFNSASVAIGDFAFVQKQAEFQRENLLIRT